MKKTIKKNIVLVMLFTMLCSYATETPTLLINKDNKTTLTLKDVKQGEQLIIKDIHGVILYRESIKKNGKYNKSFDLTNLPDGNYNFELDSEIKTTIIPFNVLLNTVKFNKKDETIIYKAFVKLEENRLYITKLNLNKDALKIKLFYENDFGEYELIYSETLEKSNKIQRIYKLSEDKKGDYKIIFESEGRVNEKTITL